MARRLCIVTNYNYGEFLNDCLESVVSQTTSFDQVIVVDDGSIDRSREIISSFTCRCANILPLLKDNGGQLSCLNAAVVHVRSDDLVWFVDSDDVFPEDYVESTEGLLRSKDVDCGFVTPIMFSKISEAPKTSRHGTEPPVYLPATSAVTRAAHSWFGAPTSCLFMRGATLLSLLPYPHEQDWKTRADDVLVFGSSIGGARKLYAPSLGVGYRTHGNNNFLGKAFPRSQYASREFHLERLFGWYVDKWRLTHHPSAARVLREIELVPKHLRKQFSVPTSLRFMLDRSFGSLPSVVKRFLTFGL
jgi:glycosyltransferase involved in cell wall biosynthesis